MNDEPEYVIFWLDDGIAEFEVAPDLVTMVERAEVYRNAGFKHVTTSVRLRKQTVSGKLEPSPDYDWKKRR